MNDENVVNMLRKRPSPDIKNGTMSKRAREAPVARASNQPNKATAPHGTTATRPANPIRSNPSSGNVVATMPTLQRSSSVGLVRVPDVRCPTKAPTVDMIIPVFQGTILGRSVDRASETLLGTKKKKHLGISALSAPGVSRKQLVVMGVKQNILTVYQPATVSNAVGISRYCATSNTMDEAKLSAINAELQLFPGDIIVFDHCRTVKDKKQRHPGPPKHIFRVVAMDMQMPVAASPLPAVASNTARAEPGSASTALTKRVRNTSSRVTSMSPNSSAAKKRLPMPASKRLIESADVAEVKPVQFVAKQSHASESEQKTAFSTPPNVDLDVLGQNQSENSSKLMRVPLESSATKQQSPLPAGPPENIDIVNNVSSPCHSPVAKGKKLLDTFEGLVEKKPLEATSDRAVAVKPAEPKSVVTASIAATSKNAIVVKTVPELFPGDRVRVWYHRSEDAFGKRRGARGWYFATVKKVMKNRIEVHFDDFSIQTMKYPAEDVELICALPHQTVYYTELGTPNQKFAYDANPTDLRLGDLVFGLYQNGASGGARFRGRVASVDHDHHTVDVAYDDGEYECNIPVSDGNLYLVSRGDDDPSWMQDIEFFTSFDNERKEAKIEQTASDGISVKFTDDNSVHVFPCSETVKLLMAYAKEKAHENRKMMDWPAKHAEKFENVFKNDKQADGDDMRKKTRNSQVAPGTSIDSSQESICGAERSVTMINHILLDDDQAVIVAPLVARRQSADPDDNAIICPDIPHEIDSSLAKVLWNALNSKLAFSGSDILNYTTNTLKEVPDVEVFRKLIALVCFGPIFNKTSPFPDASKLELAFEYLKTLLSNPKYTLQLADSALPTYWVDCLGQATSATLCALGDENRVTTAAFRRVGNSLHVSACCEEIFADLLDFQLVEFHSDPEAMRQQTYRSKAIICHMMDNCGGTRQLLKMFTRAAAHMLVWYGHHLLRNTHLEEVTKAMREALDHCRTNAERLVSALGRICVSIAWIHSAESDSHIILAQDCANLMQEAFDAECLEKNFDVSPFLDLPKGKAAAEKLKDKHWERVKYHFVLTLEGPHAAELRKCLAHRFANIRMISEI